jgi:hypothetical protein
MNLHSDDVKIVEDNSRENIKLEIEHLNFLECSLYAHNRQSEENYKIYELFFYDNHKFVEEVNFLLDMVSNKKRLEFNDNQNYQVTIYASHDIMEKIKDNYYAYYE